MKALHNSSLQVEVETKNPNLLQAKRDSLLRHTHETKQTWLTDFHKMNSVLLDVHYALNPSTCPTELRQRK